MQLKLRVGVGDTLTIDVQPTDTFQDLSDRLYSLGGVKVDLSQLRSDNRPFNMSTNVMEYFLPKLKAGDSSSGNNSGTNGKVIRRLCRLCTETIPSNPIFLFEEVPLPPPDSPPTADYKATVIEKVNSALPICVTKKDHLPKQICEGCHSRVNRTFDFMKRVVAAQRKLEEIYKVQSSEKPITNYNENARCPLCPGGRFMHIDSSCKLIPGGDKKNQENLQRKDITVSKVGKGKDTVKQEPMDEDYLEDGSVVTEYWAPGIEGEPSSSGMRKMKKRSKHEDDHDWTIDEEYVPVSRRGRPRGTKNKPKVPVHVVEKSCALCGWVGADVDMYAHAINQHVQPDMGYFPCPLCKTNHVNEIYLESHIDKHNKKTK